MPRRAYYITPTLWVGPPTGGGTTACADSVAAVKVILAGGVAVLPPDSFEEADKVLIALGVEAAVREDRFHFARTGTTLRAV